MIVGLFDSGVGGLTVLSACKKLVPCVEYLYLDDSANAPYGSRSDEYVYMRSVKNTEMLINAGCEIIIVACNTATAVAVNRLRRIFINQIIIGLEPAVAPALLHTQGNILLLATNATARIKKYPSRVTVGVEPTLAMDIEKAYGCPELLNALARRTLEKYHDFEVIVTGCSHYAHLVPYFPFKVFDGSDGVARRLAELCRCV